MKVKIKQEELQSFHLSWACIQPMLHSVRGKDRSTKLELYNQLNEGQKGLFLFYSFHNHTKTLEEFYWFSDYNINELQSWDGIKNGVLYFQDVQMANVLDEIKLLIEKQNILGRKINPSDMKYDQELFGDISKLYSRYNGCSRCTIIKMNEWINNNKDDFIEIE
ncbi:hypothetical protein BHU72_10760 [Desulfuribacillus stibiiarsenatis]|uniref:Uncharacterized protein n=1 Tax=Desulfuribacillus stibiiarsenatis TaxID=1390249 RepID=A0A1E5L2D1_9FIRM|nr:hypothetical protein [Desulfuribacillus stibiiarsenatis]OEH84287.1 hypothetical protein BHU72_10760 [Desulfuribacillus stibiiarsenatis]